MKKTKQKESTQQTYSEWLGTFTKKAVAAILIMALFDLQLTYVLAFLGRIEIAEQLSKTIAGTIVGVMLGYFLKALFETFFEEREKRLNKELDAKRDDELLGALIDDIFESEDDSEQPLRDPAEFGGDQRQASEESGKTDEQEAESCT